MKLLLILPFDKAGRKPSKSITVPKLALHILASLIPRDIALTLVDEQTGRLDPSQDFDLVGITAITATANRAYQLADSYRERAPRSSSVASIPHSSLKKPFNTPTQSSSERRKGVGRRCWPTSKERSFENSIVLNLAARKKEGGAPLASS
ncbi:MAG TPA: hypothetical protein VLW86_10305 [Syntrophorhabdales bacterium]|nr:hypothetical protein [Syntrophorhabdales bacterium]